MKSQRFNENVVFVICTSGKTVMRIRNNTSILRITVNLLNYSDVQIRSNVMVSCIASDHRMNDLFRITANGRKHL